MQAVTVKSGVQLPNINVKMPKRKDKEIEVEEANKKEKSTPFTLEKEERKETPVPIKAYVPPIYFFQRLQIKKLDKQFVNFIEVFKKLHINIHFVGTLAQLPSYAKFLKKILSNKRKLEERETACLNEEYSAILSTSYLLN